MKYFTIDELCRSSKAAALKIPNNPTRDVTANLEALVLNVLDPARAEFGAAIRVSSGYRCPPLNRAVGGAATSQHMQGQAADLDTGTRAGNARLYDIILKRGLYDQLINEHDFSWVHVSYRASGTGVNRRQTLKIN